MQVILDLQPIGTGISLVGGPDFYNSFLPWSLANHMVVK